MVNESAKIMIIDDEPSVLTLLKAFLDSKDIPCTTYESPIQALSDLPSLPIKMVLLDIDMPEMSGVEVLGKISETAPDIKVVMVTGQGDMDIAKKCLENGAIDYITKPVDLEYLETSIFAEMIMDL